MNKELEAKLVEKYPNIFKQYGGDMRVTCMAWGMSCGDGWFKLLDNLCEKLEPYDITAAQVKEKFGGLRFYIDGCSSESSDEVYKIIDEAETQSYKVCEQCGKPGELRRGGWLRTLCDVCHGEK